MAEQVSHNVVNGPQSASASALADVTATQTNAASAGTGTSINDTIAKDDRFSAVDADATTANGQGAMGAVTSAAEPSAGDAARMPPPSNAPTVTIEHSSEVQDQFGQPYSVNGLHYVASQGEGVADDGSIPDILADHSVHSDTDGSRADAGEQKMEGNHHTRTNSVKKPTTFSKVSVTKQFMAKTATVAPQAAKAGEKPSPVSAAIQLTAKPRLVAKTGSSLQTIQKARSSADSPSGPDASRVWNKNRRT